MGEGNGWDARARQTLTEIWARARAEASGLMNHDRTVDTGGGPRDVLTATAEVTRTVVDAIPHQVAEASYAHPHMHPLQDGEGRRLRASVYGRRHHTRRGGDLAATAAVIRLKRVAGTAVVMAVLASVSFFGTSGAFIDHAGALPDVHPLGTSGAPGDSLIYGGDGQVLADLHPSGVFHYERRLEQMGD